MLMLRPWIFVGFTGHRNLSQPDLVRPKIAEAIDRIARHSGGPLAAVSSAAKGADTLFVEIALAQKMPWVLLLPFSKDQFFNAQDFTPADLDRIQPLIDHATTYYVEPSGQAVGLTEEHRRAAFADCSARTVDESDYLIAVWDGRQGMPGGTQEALAYAEAQSKPIICINSLTGEVTEKNFPPLPLPSSPEPDLSRDPSAGGLPALDRTFKYYDAKAIRHAPKARNLMIWVIGLHLAATAGSLLGSVVLTVVPIAVLLLVLAKIAALVWADRLVHRHHHVKHGWLRARIIAELCRSAQATWFLSSGWSSALNVPGFRSWQRSLHLWRLSAPPAETPIDEQLRRYVKMRFDDPDSGQIPYFETHLRDAAAKQRSYSRWARRCTQTTIVISVIVAGLMIYKLIYDHYGVLPEFNLPDPHAAAVSYPEKLLKWVTLVLPLTSTAFFTVLIANDYGRRAERNRAMLAFLVEARKRILAAKTPSALERHVAETESMLLLEVLEWHSVTHFTASAH